MKRVFLWRDKKPDNLPSSFLGILINRTNSGGWHVGVACKTDQNQNDVYIMHHFRHYGGTQPGLVNQTITQYREHHGKGDLLLVTCDVDPLLIREKARRIRKIYTSNRGRGLPYGFSEASREWFDDNGKVVHCKCGEGLSCQSFVLAVFNFISIPLIVPLDPCDGRDYRPWQQRFYDENLGDSKIVNERYKAHFEALRSKIGTPVYRPTEVAVSPVFGSIPCPGIAAIRFGRMMEKLWGFIELDCLLEERSVPLYQRNAKWLGRELSVAVHFFKLLKERVLNCMKSAFGHPNR